MLHKTLKEIDYGATFNCKNLSESFGLIERTYGVFVKCSLGIFAVLGTQSLVLL